jgi:hypothetical protein
MTFDATRITQSCMQVPITRRRSLLPGLLALFIMCSLIAALGGWLFLPDLLRLVVQRLTPPAYPGAALIERAERVEFGTATEDATFRVHEQVYTVRSWMEQRMPGFKTCETDTNYIADCSTNLICDASPISKGMIWILLGEYSEYAQACVAVLIRAEPGDEDYTIIRYTLSWPAVDNLIP